MTRPCLDLSRRYFVRPYAGTGITVWGSWFREEDGRHRPCLVLLPTHSKVNHRLRPCIVTVDEAYLWDVEDKRCDARYFTNAARVFAENLGKSESSYDIATVINVVHAELGELMNIPPVPPGEMIVVADGFVTDENGKVKHSEILERV